ncbi:MAG: archease [Armatimonadetes bacterium]|nr:archease [Armatimonadota bacterium]
MCISSAIASIRRLRCPHLRPGDLVACDFDGTVTKEDVGLLMLNAVGDPLGWELEERWRRGEIDSRECLSGQWRLGHWSAESLEQFIASVETDAGFVELWRLVLARHARLVIVSDGLDLYLDPLLRRMGFEPCAGEAVLAHDFGGCVPRYVNHGWLQDGKVRVSFPHGSELCDLCANCKVEHIFRLRPHFRRVIYIGDGHSDMCPARYADLVFAKGHLADDLRERGIGFVLFRQLTEVVEVLDGKCEDPPFELLDHTADFAIRARGRDMRELIENAARGMMAVLGELEGLPAGRWHSIEISASSQEELIHHSLRELLYLFEDGDVPVTVDCLDARCDPPAAVLRVGTRPLSEVIDRISTEIKAVTYHNLRVRRENGQLVTEIVFDV